MSNYYITLGISKEADLNKIKKAYRMSCKKYHPDTNSGDVNVKDFLQIREAYETLSDKEKRRQYDEEHEKAEHRHTHHLHTLKAQHSFYQHNLQKFHSLTDDLFEGFLPGFFEEGLSSQKELYLELILSREEAVHGGVFPIMIPVFVPCITCQQTGIRGITLCPHCTGYGQVKEERSFNLVVPARVTHGTEIRMNLADIGMKDVALNVDVIVDDLYSDVTFS